MSLFSRLFGGKGPKKDDPKPEDYKGFTIYPDPIPEGQRWRLGARVEKTVGGDVKVHRLIRADVLDVKEDAILAATGKAKQVIDELGDRLFD